MLLESKAGGVLVQVCVGFEFDLQLLLGFEKDLLDMGEFLFTLPLLICFDLVDLALELERLQVVNTSFSRHLL